MTDTTFWDKVARKYAKRPIGNLPAYEATLDRVRSYLTPPDKVLEVGCGTGSTALLLAESVAQYTATDASPKMIEIAREKLASEGRATLDFVVAPMVEDRFASGTFDVILGFNILHLLPDLQGALARSHELLTPGGLFITKTPCLRQMGWYIRPLVAVMRLLGKAPALRYLSPSDLEAEIRRFGFEIAEARAFEGARLSWFIVARRV